MAVVGGEPESNLTPQPLEEDPVTQEREHFRTVVNAFGYYRSYAEGRLERVRRNYDKLPVTHRKMLQDFPDHCIDIGRAVEVNEKFVKAIIRNAVGMFEDSQVSKFDSDFVAENVTRASTFHMEKVLTTIKQFYRDWSEEGAREREMCYKPIVEDILLRFPIKTCATNILVPGAGLGRLAFEIACHGYACQGNEFSVFMLLGSNFILNQCREAKLYPIHPWIHQYSNLLSYNHQTAEIRVPDVCPSDAKTLQDFSMAAGDFLEVYTAPDQWDCVACCFFIDTAHNVIRYLERIYHILKPGGYWINFGPLLYHFTDIPNEFSIELSWEDIRRVAVEHIGFEIVKEVLNQPSTYIQNPHSMMEMSYKCVFVVARKPPQPQQRDSLLKEAHHLTEVHQTTGANDTAN